MTGGWWKGKPLTSCCAARVIDLCQRTVATMSITKEREAYGLTEVERKFEHLTDFVLAMAVAGLGMVITFLEFARSVRLRFDKQQQVRLQYSRSVESYSFTGFSHEL
jgi:hypothetical protein